MQNHMHRDDAVSWDSRGCQPTVSNFDVVVLKEETQSDGSTTAGTESEELASEQTGNSGLSIDLDMEETTDLRDYVGKTYTSTSSEVGAMNEASVSSSIVQACRALLQGVSSCSGQLRAPSPNGELDTRLRVQQPQRGVRRYGGENVIAYKFHKLERLALLGSGTYGSVSLVQCHVTGQKLALKSVPKGVLCAKQMQHKAKHEKLILQHVRSPFVIKLAACFNRNDTLHFLMEAATGGDLYTIYGEKDFFGSEKHARFYTACIATGLSHLHSQQIVYRDLKPENVVVNSHGYAKLCDLGMATFLVCAGKTASCRAYTICGTAVYMAPEMASPQGYDYSVDWWSLGIVVFEMIMGRTPFVGDSISEILSKARAGIEKVLHPLNADWTTVVLGLCKRKPFERLPCLRGGIQNLQMLPWFQTAQFDWDTVRKCQLAAPFVPAAWKPNDWRNSLDMCNTLAVNHVPYQDPGTGWDRDFEDVFGPVCLDNDDDNVVTL